MQVLTPFLTRYCNTFSVHFRVRVPAEFLLTLSDCSLSRFDDTMGTLLITIENWSEFNARAVGSFECPIHRNQLHSNFSRDERSPVITELFSDFCKLLFKVVDSVIGKSDMKIDCQQRITDTLLWT